MIFEGKYMVMQNVLDPNNHGTLHSIGLMFGQHRRPWTNIKSALGQRSVLGGMLHEYHIREG